MNQTIRWGILSTAKIGLKKVIPAMQQGKYSRITAIASRNLDQAQKAASQLNIPKAYGSYEQLLEDPEIDAIYNPLPNHLHIFWTQKAMEAGKHVLCEKPMALDLTAITSFISFAKKYPALKVGEAFMVKTHPQWLKVQQMVQQGDLGEITAIQAFFSYFKLDPDNIRNKPEYGGGGIYDIGVYPLTLSRFILKQEPKRVLASIDYDPNMKVDRLASVILEFPGVQASFICGTQTVPYQTFQVFGNQRRLEVQIPYNSPIDRPTYIFLSDGDIFERDKRVIEISTLDQYTVQGDQFSKAILEDLPVPVSLEDTYYNTLALEAIFQSDKTGKKVSPQELIK